MEKANQDENEKTEKFITHSREETQNLGAWLARKLSRGDTVLLTGDLGAGKTTFVQGVARALGCDSASSPTFTIVHPYPCELGGKPLTLYHFDCYRLSGANELYEAGLDEFLDDPDGIAIVEWPENIQGAWPKRNIMVRMDTIGPEVRKITIIL